MKNIKFDQNRLFLLTWMIVPIIFVWIAISYLIGLNRPPIWASENSIDITAYKTPIRPKIADFNWQGTGLITLWFDDGWRSQYYSAFPILQQRQLPAAIAVTTNFVGLEGYVNWSQLKRLQYFGWETTAHTKSHNCNLIKEDDSKILTELVESKKIIEAHGMLADNFVTPCGADSPKLIEIVKQNYASLRTSGAGLNPIPVKTPYILHTSVLNNTSTLEEIAKSIEEAKKTHTWLVLTFHQIDDNNTEYSVSPKLFEQIADLVKNSGLPTVLPIQVLEITQPNKDKI